MAYDDDYEEAAPMAGPGDMTISETAIKWDAQRMFDSIARMAAGRIVENCQRDLIAATSSSVKDQIDAQVGAKVAEVLDASIQPTNEYGEVKGKPTSLREMVGQAARDYLGTKVDKEGRASSYNAENTRLEYIVKKVVEKEIDYRLQTEIKKAVELARAQAVAKVSTVVGDLIVKLGN